jgi:hypothetical protein
MFISEVSTESLWPIPQMTLTFYVHVSCNCSNAACLVAYFITGTSGIDKTPAEPSA